VTVEDFKRALTTFADSPADVDLRKGTLVLQIGEDIIEASVAVREGDVTVTENGHTFSAAKWLIQRVAHLPLLADRILAHTPHESTFVSPDGDMLDTIDASPDDRDRYVPDAPKALLGMLDSRPAGAASVVYLTSDAGEGKTTLISYLARMQAERYKQKTTDWLLVPISLGGRTFMRFDDVIVGALMNRFRFNLLFYDAFLELVRLGAVIPALDGFEEMFVEGTGGDAMSALGNLMQAMQSTGSVLIAARKAYFEYKDLRAQTRLFDSLGGQSVTFTRLALRRWDKSRFLSYAQKRGIADGPDIYDDVSAQLAPDHPLLSRAVLVRRLLDIAGKSPDRTELLRSITRDPSDYFRQFIGSIIQREANEKWIDKVGEPAQPLISEEEHYELLSSLAFEMWSNGTENLPADVVAFVAEMFAESKKKNKVISHQIVERLKQHALIISTGNSRISFDHPEFYHFFLGDAIGQMILRGDAAALRHAFRESVLPLLAMETAARAAAKSGRSMAEIIGIVNGVFDSEARMSLVRENMSGIVGFLLDIAQVKECTVAGCTFPCDALRGRHFSDLGFANCYFQRTSLDKTRLRNVRFGRCEFEGIDLSTVEHIENVELVDCTVRNVIAVGGDTSVFAPTSIAAALIEAGINVTSTDPIAQPATGADVDESLKAVERLLRAFMRSPSGLNENTIRQRLGTHAAIFFRDVLPRIETAGLIAGVEYRGRDHQRRFRLAARLDSITDALERCEGDFERFLALAK